MKKKLQWVTMDGKDFGEISVTVERDAKIQALVKDEGLVLEGGEHWVALMVGDGTYLAVWMDENGDLQTASRKTQQGAIKLASGSWGR